MPPVTRGELFVTPIAQGSVDIVLHPGATVRHGTPVTIAFGVPFPRGFVTSATQIRVTDAMGTEIPSAVTELAPWRSIGASSGPASLRAVLVYVQRSFSDATPVTIRLEWGASRALNLGGPLPEPAALWTSIAGGPDPSEYPAADDIREPAVYATLPAAWLGEALLRGPATPSGEDADLAWWDDSVSGFARTAVNEVAATVPLSAHIDYLDDAEPWLFDRAMTLFGLYIRTGDVHWLRHAHRAAQWYASRVNARGIFALVSYDDLKYSYGASLLVDYFLTGDTALSGPIQRIGAAGIAEWRTTYSTTQNFWTERHHAYALRAALAAFALTGDAAQATRATALADLVIQMSRNAAHCPLHTIEQHEGDTGDARMMCSPWMSALLSDAMMEYYIVSEDREVLRWIAGMGAYVRDFALYDGGIEHAELAGRKMTWYLAGIDERYEDGQRGWGDMEHACDVGGMTARAAWAQRQLSEDAASLQQITVQLLDTCQYVLDSWHRSTPTLPEWRLSPPRKFNWWFGTTLGHDWFLTH